MSNAEFPTPSDHPTLLGSSQRLSRASVAVADSSTSVRTLYDAFRRSFAGGQVVKTLGVVDLREADRIALLLAVRRFDSFDPANDPHGEHDFGAVEVGGERFFW